MSDLPSSTWVDLNTAPLDTVVERLNDDSPLWRADAACALGDRLRTHEISGLSDAVRDRLRAMLGDRDGWARLEAAIALAEAHDRLALPALLEGMRVRAMRLDAIRALGALGDRAAITPLAEMMGRWLLPWADRMQAAAALCALGDPAGAAYLGDKLGSRKTAERAAAIHFLGESRHPRARDILERILADVADPMRDVAARALGLLGDQAAVPALQRALPDADAELRIDIDGALAKLG